MLKKIVTGAATVAVAGSLILGADALSYLRTVGSNVRQAVKKEISVEFELDRIRNEVQDLMPEIRRHLETVAEQSVDVKDLQRVLAERQSDLATQKNSILTLRKDLESDRQTFVYRTVSWSRSEVEADLAHRFAAFCTAEECVKRDQQILSALKDTLQANQRKLDTMLIRKQDLVVKVAQLEARLKQVQAAETVNSMEVDDTQLARVEKLIHDMNHALDVRESVMEAEGNLQGRIPVEQSSAPAPDDVLGKIDSHFSLKMESPAPAASEALTSTATP
ncbi:MAG: hypothetical protein RLZZ232_281 [Planctomycetota bacterium]